MRLDVVCHRREADFDPCTGQPSHQQTRMSEDMGSGTDVSRESADVVLIGNDLTKFVETVRIARNCRRIILQNFYGTLIVDTIGVGLAAAGILNPLLATFFHVASELVFILNSMLSCANGERKGCQPGAGSCACLGNIATHRIFNTNALGMILAVLF
jgi:hypothetical protein